MAKSAPGQPPSKQGGAPDAPTKDQSQNAQAQGAASSDTTTPTTDSTKSTTPPEPPAKTAPDDGRPAEDGARWECPIKSHWSTRNASTAAVWRDGSYYCPECGFKLVKVSD